MNPSSYIYIYIYIYIYMSSTFKVGSELAVHTWLLFHKKLHLRRQKKISNLVHAFNQLYINVRREYGLATQKLTYIYIYIYIYIYHKLITI
jgi:hypothetical protein